MDYIEALKMLDNIGHKGVKNFTRLCREDNPDIWQRNGYRDLVVKLAQGMSLSEPSLWDKTKSVTRAAVDFVKSGFDIVDQEEFDRRHNICISCEFFKDEVCLKCTCNLKIKPWARALECPIGKWKSDQYDTDRLNT